MFHKLISERKIPDRGNITFLARKKNNGSYILHYKMKKTTKNKNKRNFICVKCLGKTKIAMTFICVYICIHMCICIFASTHIH